jgi:hypothetical protein
MKKLSFFLLLLLAAATAVHGDDGEIFRSV